MAEEVNYIEYKGRAFVRENDTICYGNMTDKCILYMLIMSYKKFGDTEIPEGRIGEVSFYIVKFSW